MKIEVPVHDIVIAEAGSDKHFKVRTVRSAAEVASYIEETEGEWMHENIEEAVSQTYQLVRHK